MQRERPKKEIYKKANREINEIREKIIKLKQEEAKVYEKYKITKYLLNQAKGYRWTELDEVSFIHNEEDLNNWDMQYIRNNLTKLDIYKKKI